jgi:hypothetical protein
MESRNRVVSAPKEHGKRVTLLAMTRCAPNMPAASAFHPVWSFAVERLVA